MLWLIFILISTVFSNAQSDRKDLIETLKFKPNLITKKSIIQEHEIINDNHYNPNNRDGLVQLAYITPWNNHGYDLAKKTAHKLTHVSPVWLQAKVSYEDGRLYSCKIEGTHDIDRDWMNELLDKNQKLKIVPRILFDGWNSEEMRGLLMDTQVSMRCFKAIANFYSRNNFDGAVVEFYMQALIATQSLEAKELIIESIHALSKQMKKLDLLVITTVPAPLEWNSQPNNLVTPADYQKLSEASDFVQIMTYDYRGNKPAGVAPYDWFENCIFYLRTNDAKTLAGLNYYGYQFSSGNVDAITFGKYLELLKDPKSVLEFDEKSMEHRIRTSNSVTYYPSLTSLELRINMAHRYEVGIAIWDYGQGLDYFTNLLI